MGPGPSFGGFDAVKAFWWPLHERKIRYLLAGAWNTLFGYLAFIALYGLANFLRLHYLVALTVSQILATTNAYLSYKHFVFKTRGGYVREYFRFSAVYWALFAANFVMLPVLVHAAHMGPVLAQGIILPVTVAAGYVIHGRFSFSRSAVGAGT